MRDADIIGQDNRALQAAVDYVGNLGGGTVLIGPGVYLMEDALHLCSHVTIRGEGDKSVLRKSPGRMSLLAADGDYGDDQLTLADPSGFQVGMGVAVADDHAHGFHVTVATIVASEGNVFQINGTFQADYVMSGHAYAANVFPIVSGRYVENIRLKNLTIEGNKTENMLLTGCRGAGIYFHRARKVEIIACTVRDYNGDGISFQQSEDVQVVECLCQGNSKLGIHPGSGSQRPVIGRCRSLDNGEIGLFFCWRVKHGMALDNELLRNGHAGLSIGHKDTDNLIEGNVISGNGVVGILFRDELEPQGAHRNRVLNNTIQDNGNEKEGYGIKISGETHDLLIRDNIIGDTRPAREKRQCIGVYVGVKSRDVTLEGNRFQGNAVQDVYREAA